MLSRLVFWSALTALSSQTLAVSPGRCRGGCHNAHDPSVIHDGTKFWRFSTGALGQIHTALSIEGPWEYLEHCGIIPGPSKITVPGDVWAPDVSRVGDEYYVYYSISKSGSQNSAIGLSTSPNLECNTYTDHGPIGVSSQNGGDYNAIDANLLYTQGKYLLNYGSFWGGLYQVEMQNPPVATGGPAKHIAHQPAGSEAAFMIEYSSYYFLFFSTGACCHLDQERPQPGQEYQIMVCRSTSPSGGFVDQNGRDCQQGGGTTILASGGNVYAPGGQSLFQYNGTWTMVYHYVDKNIGFADGEKVFGWNDVSWTSDTWPVLVG